MSKHWDPRTFPGGRRLQRPVRRWNPQHPFGRRPTRYRRGGGNDAIGMMIVCGVALGLLMAWGPPALSGGGFRGAGETVHPTNVWVIDGDTFDVGGVRVRVADIDTPEVRGECAAESHLAARATARMRTLLEEGEFQVHPIFGRDE